MSNAEKLILINQIITNLNILKKELIEPNKDRNEEIYKDYLSLKNLAEVGRKYNLSRERVRQIVAKVENENRTKSKEQEKD